MIDFIDYDKPLRKNERSLLQDRTHLMKNIKMYYSLSRPR
jgi:hypothetical protein